MRIINRRQERAGCRQEDFFVMPYAAVHHLFQVKPNKGTGWHVYVVRNRLYVVSEKYGVVDVTACRSDREDARRLALLCHGAARVAEAFRTAHGASRACEASGVSGPARGLETWEDLGGAGALP